MKKEYQVPEIEMLDVKDTAYNYYFDGQIVLENNCGGWGSVNNFHITSPAQVQIVEPPSGS